MHAFLDYVAVSKYGTPIEYQFKREHDDQPSNFGVADFRTNPHEHVDTQHTYT